MQPVGVKFFGGGQAVGARQCQAEAVLRRQAPVEAERCRGAMVAAVGLCRIGVDTLPFVAQRAFHPPGTEAFFFEQEDGMLAGRTGLDIGFLAGRTEIAETALQR